MNDVNDYFGKNFKVFFSDGSVGAFKCNYVNGKLIGNDTFGMIVSISKCELLPEWAQ